MKWHHKPHRILIVSNALSVVEYEAHHARNINKEQGGSLVGIQDENTSIILHAIHTGPDAEVSWGHIRTDAEFQNKCLAPICAHYDRHAIRVVYLSDYHIHEMGYDKLSSTDNAAFLSIMSDPDHSYLSGMPVILVSVHGEHLKYIPFWITRSGKGVRTETAELEIVAPYDSRVRAILKGKPYMPLEEILNLNDALSPSLSSPGSANHDVAFQGDILMARLSLEMEYIRSTLAATPQLRRTCRGYPCIFVQIGDCRLYAVIPSEYPLNPASIFYKSGASDISDYYPRRAWNSISRIGEIYEEILETKGQTISGTSNTEE